MAIEDAFKSVKQDLDHHSRYNKNAQMSSNLCILKRINAQKLTADIFIPKTSSNLFNVPLVFPFTNRDSGILIMPKENSAALVITTSDLKAFVVSSVNNKFTDDNLAQILDNENVMFSLSKSVLKQDNLGNQILLSGGGSLDVMSRYGEIKEYSTSKASKTLSSSTIKGVTDIITENGTRTLEYSKYAGTALLPIKYAKEDVLDISGNNFIVNEDKKNIILSSAEETLSKISTLFNDIDALKKSMLTNPYLSKEQIKIKVSESKTKLYNDYSITKKTALIVEKGVAINKDINNIEDLNNLTISDVVLSEQGNNINFRIRVTNQQTGIDVATLTFDDEGYVKLRCKDFKTEYI